MSLNVVVFVLCMKDFRWMSERPPMKGSSLPESERVGSSLLISTYCSKASTSLILNTFATTTFLSAMAMPVMRCTNEAMDAIHELDFRSFFGSLLDAALVCKKFTTWACSVSPIKSSRNRSIITCSTTLSTTERIPLWTLWYNVRRMSSKGY